MAAKTPADSIFIEDLLVRGIIGVNDWEREAEQDILVNVSLSVDLSRAGRSDSIEDTVNYRVVTKKMIALVESTQRFTLEALAADIAAICLAEPGVRRARVRVEKPGALRFARSVGVEIEREAGDAG